MKRWLCFQVWILLSNLSWSQETDYYPTVRVLYRWKVAEFDYPTKQARYEAIQRGDFIPNQVALLAADYYREFS